MKYFVCLVAFDGQPLSSALLRRYERLPQRQGLAFRWDAHRVTGPVGACELRVLSAWARSPDPLTTVSDGRSVAVGTVRLDNRSDLGRSLGSLQWDLPDLELVRRAIVCHGVRCVPHMLGDFAFVAWDGRTGSLVAATDAFSVRKLYYAKTAGVLALATRAEALALDGDYDEQFLAEQVAGGAITPGLSPYAGVRRVPAGTVLAGTPDRLSSQAYWSPNEFLTDPTWSSREAEAAAVCRELLTNSVRERLDPDRHNWAHLSGGLDSSSIVSIAQWLAEQGEVPRALEGTVTYVDLAGTDADERSYSSAVAARWDVPNHAIVDPPLWVDDGQHPPSTDWPGASLAFYPRDRRLIALLGDSPGPLLTGFGGDELFTGTMFFFADWIARGHLIAAFREMTRRAAIGHASVWALAYQNAVLPLMPASARRWFNAAEGRLHSWITAAAARKYHLHDRLMANASHAGPVAAKYHHALTAGVAALSHLLEPGFLGEAIELRYPFLYRPLVEFALTLPPELCVRPQARKWILREAMRGLLPEVVRRRIGKGGVQALLAWSLTTQRQLLEPLTDDPMLAELGIVDAVELRRAFQLALCRPHRDDFLQTQVQSTLMLEAWLQLRSNRWPRKSRSTNRVRQVMATTL